MHSPPHLPLLLSVTPDIDTYCAFNSYDDDSGGSSMLRAT